MATHHKEDAARMAPAPSRRRTRGIQGPLPPTSQARVNAGMTIQAASILVRNPHPIRKPLAHSHQVAVLPSACNARVSAYAADTSSRTSSVSGLLSRLMATVMGVRVSTSAATSAAPSPAQRRTVRCRTSTAATPSII